MWGEGDVPGPQPTWEITLGPPPADPELGPGLAGPAHGNLYQPGPYQVQGPSPPGAACKAHRRASAGPARTSPFQRPSCSTEDSRCGGSAGLAPTKLGAGEWHPAIPHPLLPVRIQSVVTANSEAAHGVSPVGSGRTRAPASAPARPLQSEGSRELGDTLFVSRTRHSSSRNSKFNMNTPHGNTQNCLISISKGNNYIRKSHPH